jgi:predicted nucleic acid-binding Zn ribbon protein
MALERIGPSLQRLLDEAGLAQPLVGWKALSLWPEIVGERVASRSRAVSWHAGRLIVEVDAPSWVNHLSFLRRACVRRLNERLGAGVVLEIQFIAARGGRG